jgi:hypothetical protein
MQFTSYNVVTMQTMLASMLAGVKRGLRITPILAAWQLGGLNTSLPQFHVNQKLSADFYSLKRTNRIDHSRGE